MRFQTLFHQFFSSLLVFGMCLFLVLLSHTSLMLNCQICLVFFFKKKKNPPTYATCQAAPSTFPKPTYFLTEQVVYTPSRPFLKLSFHLQPDFHSTSPLKLFSRFIINLIAKSSGLFTIHILLNETCHSSFPYHMSGMALGALHLLVCSALIQLSKVSS